MTSTHSSLPPRGGQSFSFLARHDAAMPAEGETVRAFEVQLPGKEGGSAPLEAFAFPGSSSAGGGFGEWTGDPLPGMGPDGRWTVYTFEVEGTHTYIAGGVRVHNTSGALGRIGNAIDHGLFGTDGGVLDAAGDILTAPLHVLGEIWDGAARAASHFVTNLGRAGQALVNGDLVGAVVYAGSAVIGAVGEFVAGVGRAIGEAVTAVGEAIAKTVGAIADGFQKVADAIGEFFGGDNGDGASNGKPLVLDLDGDGVEIAVDGTVSFDMDGDGFLEQTAWVAPDDGLIVIDLAADGTLSGGDGVIDQTTEVVLTSWFGLDEELTDLQALGLFDMAELGGNGDGIIDEGDEIWRHMRVWQDANANGVVDEGEMLTLADHGVTGLAIVHDSGLDHADASDDVTIFGSSLLGTASVRYGEAWEEGRVGDVSLRYGDLGWRRVETEFGYKIEFEQGDALRYRVMDGTGAADANLVADWFDGAAGDDRANVLDATGHTRAVSISGGLGNDILTGGDQGDFISGDEGADTLRGGAGDDVIFFDAADAVVEGGSGRDTAIATGDAGVSLDLGARSLEIAYGTDAADVLDGGSAPVGVSLHGLGGDDQLKGGWATDQISGGAGVDLIWGRGGDDRLFGGADGDHIWAEAGDDYVAAGSGNDGIAAGDGDDHVLGGSGDDNIWGESGSDLLDGGSGNDTVWGGEGDDEIYGGDGNDILVGEGGDDKLYGGAGDDVFYDHWGDDMLYGGAGNDLFRIGGEDGYECVLGQQGYDILELTGHRSEWSITQSGTVFLLTKGWQHVRAQDVELFRFTGGGEHHTGWDASADNSASFSRWHSILNDREPTGTWTVHSDYPTAWFRADGDGHYWSGGIGDDSVTTMVARSFYWVDDDEHLNNQWIRATGSYEWRDFSGGTGQDDIRASDYADTIRGGSGDDTVSAGSGDDWINGEDGDDSLYGMDGHDQIWGASGDDVISGGNGNDAIYGGSGADQIDGSSGFDTIRGESGSDIIFGGAHNDTIHGDDGDDQIDGGTEDDILYGGTGADSLFGGAGQDHLEGGVGADTLLGGDGHDGLYGGYGRDRLYGENGSDTLRGGEDDDFLHGGASTDYLHGDAGNDVLEGGAGADQLHGGAGNDTASYNSAASGVAVSLASGLRAGEAIGDTFSSIENLVGSQFGDELYGDGGHNVLDGGAGNDLLKGGAGNDYLLSGDDAIGSRLYGEAGDDVLQGFGGNDVLDGGTGDDVLLGDKGDDQIDGGAGSDRLYGGIGSDVFIFSTGDGFDRIEDFDVEADRVRINGAEFSIDALPAGIEVTRGENEELVLRYGTGDQITLEGVSFDAWAPGSLEVLGTEGADLIDAAFVGAAGGRVGDRSQTITALGGDDVIRDGAGHDMIDGGDGNDRFENGAGNDTVTGGRGNDVFIDGAGDDTYYGTINSNTFHAGEGANHYGGGTWWDKLYYGAATSGIVVDLADPSRNAGLAAGDTISGIEFISGTDYDDDIGGSFRQIVTGDGNDILRDGIGAQSMTGGSGADTFLLTSDTDQDTINDFSLGVDRLEIDGILIDPSALPSGIIASQSGNDVLLTHGDGDTLLLRKQSVTDWVSGSEDSSGPALEIWGTEGADLIDAAYIDPTGGRIADNGQTITALGGDDVIRDGTGHDTIYGGDGNDRFENGAGNDTVTGGDGNDVFVDGAGDDTFYGGNHTDAFYAGAGANVFDGGSGWDKVFYSGATAGIVVDELDPSRNAGMAAGDTYSGIEFVDGTDFDDDIGGLFRQISGGAGNDILRDGAASYGQSLTGSYGVDTFVFCVDGVEDTIQHFEIGTDVIDISSWGLVGFDDLTIAERFDASGTKSEGVIVSAGNEAIRLSYRDADDIPLITEDSFIFV